MYPRHWLRKVKMNALCTRGVPGSSIFKALSAHSAPARLCSFVPQGPLGVLKKTSSAVRDPYGVCRAFTSQSSQREAFTSFGNKQVPVGEKEKLVGGVFTSVAGERTCLRQQLTHSLLCHLNSKQCLNIDGLENMTCLFYVLQQDGYFLSLTLRLFASVQLPAFLQRNMI